MASIGAWRAGAGDGRLRRAARADTFPSKQIRWVIPFAPGGNYDVTSRIVADPMGRQLGQTMLIDNRPGAGGVVGLDAAVNAPADGYTIVMASFTVRLCGADLRRQAADAAGCWRRSAS